MKLVKIERALIAVFTSRGFLIWNCGEDYKSICSIC
jgi:hypothetical protein